MEYNGQFKATFLWNEIISFVFSHIKFQSKKVQRKYCKQCVFGSEVVDIVHIFLLKQNGNLINVPDLTRENAVKVFLKMIEMKILLSLHSDECNEQNFYKVEETHICYESCPKDRSLCMNTRLPLCSEMDQFIRNSPCQANTRSRSFLKKQFDCENFLVSSPLENQYSSVKCFQEITPTSQKRHNLFKEESKDDIGSSLPKVKYMRRRSYNLANRHSQIYSKKSFTRTSFSNLKVPVHLQYQSISRLLCEFDIPMIDNILDFLTLKECGNNVDYVFENKTFEEPEFSLHDEAFLNASLKCLSVVPSGLNGTRTMYEKKLICLEAVRLFYKKKCMIPKEFDDLFVNIVKFLCNDKKSATSLSVFNISQLFLHSLPVDVKKKLIALVNFIKCGRNESVQFYAEQNNENFFTNYFTNVITQSTEVTHKEIVTFIKYFTDNISVIIKLPSETVLTYPCYTKLVENEEYLCRSKMATKTEIRSLMNHIKDSSVISNTKKRMLMKKLEKQNFEKQSLYLQNI